MNRIDRLFGILVLLQSRKYIGAENIAEKYQISIRTVYRDLKAIGESGVPIGFEPNKGYCILQGYFLPPVSFTNEEANALLLMETAANSYGDRSIQKYYSSALGKVKAVLKGAQKEKLENLSNSIQFQIPERLHNDSEYLAEIQNAISTKSLLQIEYKNNKEELSKREVEPLGLIFYAFSWHLIAWCHQRSDYRDFKVSRIIYLKDLQQSFRKQSHIPLSEYMKLLPVNY